MPSPDLLNRQTRPSTGFGSGRSQIPAVERVSRRQNIREQTQPWTAPNERSRALGSGIISAGGTDFGAGATPSIDQKYRAQNMALIQALSGYMAPGSTMGIGNALADQYDLPHGFQAARPAAGQFLTPGSPNYLAATLQQGKPAFGNENPAFGGAYSRQGWWLPPDAGGDYPGANGLPGGSISPTEGVRSPMITWDPKSGYIPGRGDAQFDPPPFTWAGGKPPKGYIPPRLYGTNYV
jgi:hypothetical protein